MSESQLFGPLLVWVVDGGPLGCHCRRLVSPRFEMPISRNYGVGRWVDKPTAVLLLPHLSYREIQYGVLCIEYVPTHPLKVPCGLPGTVNQEHGVWSSIHYGVQ